MAALLSGTVYKNDKFSTNFCNHCFQKFDRMNNELTKLITQNHGKINFNKVNNLLPFFQVNQGNFLIRAWHSVANYTHFLCIWKIPLSNPEEGLLRVKVGNTEKSIIKQHLCFSITFHGFLLWQFFVICAEVVIRDLVVFVVIISNQFHSTFPSTNEILLGRCNLVMIALIAQFRDLKIDFQTWWLLMTIIGKTKRQGWSHTC